MDSFLLLLKEGGVFSYWVLILGLLANVACIYLLVRSFWKGSRRACLITTNICAASVLLLVAIGWLGQENISASVSLALPDIESELRTPFMLHGFAAGRWNVLFALLMCVIPLLCGTALLVRGLMTREEDAKPRPILDWIGIGCLWAGCGLGCWALAALLRFGDFRLGLMLCFW